MISEIIQSKYEQWDDVLGEYYITAIVFNTDSFDKVAELYPNYRQEIADLYPDDIFFKLYLNDNDPNNYMYMENHNGEAVDTTDIEQRIYLDLKDKTILEEVGRFLLKHNIDFIHHTNEIRIEESDISIYEYSDKTYEIDNEQTMMDIPKGIFNTESLLEFLYPDIVREEKIDDLLNG